MPHRATTGKERRESTTGRSTGQSGGGMTATRQSGCTMVNILLHLILEGKDLSSSRDNQMHIGFPTI